MRHILVHCPGCGEGGYVRIDHMGLQLKCKHCKSLFHIDSAGRCVPGRIQQGRSDPLDFGLIETRGPDPFAFLERVPRPVRYMGGGLIVILLALLIYRTASRDSLDLPSSLEDRAIFVSQAFVDDDLGRLSGISASGTSRSTGEWVKKHRPKHWGPQVVGKPVDVDVSVVFQDGQKGRACVVATVQIPALGGLAIEPEPARTPGLRPAVGKKVSEPPVRVPQLELLLYWKLSEGGEWFLDGDETLKKM